MKTDPTTRQRSAHRLFYLSALFVFASMSWAFFSPLDVTTQAQGVVMPSSRIKSIQHLEGGIVQDILVKEGETVSRNQPLLKLDPVKSRADLEELRRRLQGLTAEMGRLQSEAENRAEPVFDPEVVQSVPALIQTEREIFFAKRRHFLHELQILLSLITQREQELVENRTRLENNRKILETVTSQVSISKKMIERSLTSQMTHLDLVRQQQAMEGQIAADRTAQPRMEAALKEARERADSLRSDFAQTARKELTLARQSRDELLERLRKFQHVQDLTILRSPVEGIVKSIAVSTEGGVIQPGQTVMDIVPIEDQLVIDAKLPVQDIGYVHAGQFVWVTLDSQDALLFGRISGRVEGVSPDALISAEGRTFYRIRIVTERKSFDNNGANYSLYPGVQVVCLILVGTRTVMEYLLTPWLRTFHATFQER